MLDLDSTCEQKYVIVGFLSLSYFTQNDLQFHSFSCKQHTFVLFWAEYTIVYVYHIFFLHWLVVGYLNWLHDLAVVYSTAMNMGVQVLLCILIYIPSDKWQRGVDPGH
jgi:hypothetical protein